MFWLLLVTNLAIVQSFTFDIFSIFVFCGEATKKTSIDGLKWRDLVMVVWVGGGW